MYDISLNQLLTFFRNTGRQLHFIRAVVPLCLLFCSSTSHFDCMSFCMFAILHFLDNSKLGFNRKLFCVCNLLLVTDQHLTERIIAFKNLLLKYILNYFTLGHFMAQVLLPSAETKVVTIYPNNLPCTAVVKDCLFLRFIVTELVWKGCSEAKPILPSPQTTPRAIFHCKSSR